tara:strand:+ start:174 stop:374 length:201 start_codon:yes stop_codon:yes gene_type:complete
LIAFCSDPVRKEIVIRSLLNSGLRSNGITEKVKTLQDLLAFTEKEKGLLANKLSSISRLSSSPLVN